MTAKELYTTIITVLIAMIFVVFITSCLIMKRKEKLNFNRAESCARIICSIGILIFAIIEIVFSPMKNHEKAIGTLEKNGEVLQELSEQNISLDITQKEMFLDYCKAWLRYQDNIEKNDDFWYRNVGEFPKYYCSNAGTLMKGEN